MKGKRERIPRDIASHRRASPCARKYEMVSSVGRVMKIPPDGTVSELESSYCLAQRKLSCTHSTIRIEGRGAKGTPPKIAVHNLPFEGVISRGKNGLRTEPRGKAITMSP